MERNSRKDTKNSQGFWQKISKAQKIVGIGVTTVIVLMLGVALIPKVVNGEFSDDYGEVSTTYDDYVKVAEQYNSQIDSAVETADKAVEDAGLSSDAEEVKELEAKKEELLSYKIEIKETKPRNRDELIKETERMRAEAAKSDERLAGGFLKSDMVDEYLETYGRSGTKITALVAELRELTDQVVAIANQNAMEKAEMEKINAFLEKLEGAKFTYNNGSLTLTVSREQFAISGDNRDKVYKISEMEKIAEDGEGGYRFTIKSYTTTTVTGYTINLSDAFHVYADGQVVDFVKDLGVEDFKRVN